MVKVTEVKVANDNTISPQCPCCGRKLTQIRLSKTALIAGLSVKCKFCGAIIEIKTE